MSTATVGPVDAVRAIRALEAEFQRLANAGNAAALIEAFYAEDGALMPPNAPQVNGKAAILDFWKAFLATGLSELALETGNIVSSGDLAYSIGKYSYRASGERHTGKYVTIYRRQLNGSYRATTDIFNTNA